VRYFFLSYARKDEAAYVKKFSNLLRNEIRMKTGLDSSEEIGFLDTSDIDLGRPWPEALSTALTESHTFLALCSPTYFRSDYCGREWAALAQRIERHEQLYGVRPPVLLPLIWVRNTKLDSVAAELQYTTDDLGQTYQREGLLNCMRHGEYISQRRRLIETLAEKIVWLANNYRLAPPAAPLSINSLQSPFTRASHQGARSAETSRLVYLVVAAASKSGMRGLRQSLDYYGRASRDWAPYHSDLRDPVASFASGIAQELDFHTEILPIEQLDARLDEIRLRNQMVVLLVDAWSTKLEKKRAALQRFDDRNDPTSAVMVPMNHQDHETVDTWSDLNLEIDEVLRNNRARANYHMFHLAMPTHRDFDHRFRAVLSVAQNEVFRSRAPKRLPPGSQQEHLDPR